MYREISSSAVHNKITISSTGAFVYRYNKTLTFFRTEKKFRPWLSNIISVLVVGDINEY